MAARAGALRNGAVDVLVSRWPTGYVELAGGEGDGAVTRIRYLGLLPGFCGRGLGGQLVADATRRAWTVHLRTRTSRRFARSRSTPVSGRVRPHSANYLARGYRLVRCAEVNRTHRASDSEAGRGATETLRPGILNRACAETPRPCRRAAGGRAEDRQVIEDIPAARTACAGSRRAGRRPSSRSCCRHLGEQLGASDSGQPSVSGTAEAEHRLDATYCVDHSSGFVHLAVVVARRSHPRTVRASLC